MPESQKTASTRTAGVRLADALIRVFSPDPAAPHIETDPAKVQEGFRFYQKRVLIATIVGYAAFYFVRKNLSISMPAMIDQLGISKSQLGIYLTLHGVIYGVSKFVNGFFGDRCNARTFMVTGLVLSAVLNIFFGMSSMAIWLGIFWMLNGWAQGMGFPPCARLITNWFSPKELAMKMSIWNTSHSIGAGLVVIICGYLVAHNWRLGFFVPAAMALAVALYLKFTLPDLPESVGLPEVEGTESSKPAGADGEVKESFKEILITKVFTNPYIWMISLANFFVYSIRYAVLDWSPTMLKEAKGFAIEQSGWMTAGFEFAGIFGMLMAGWISDRWFDGKAARTCFLYMIMCCVAVYLYWKVPNQTPSTAAAILCMTGFFIYGPQALIGVIVANLSTKKAAATAVGLTGLFGYASSVVSGWGFGLLADKKGWDLAFEFMFIFALVGTGLFALTWFAPRDTYDKD